MPEQAPIQALSTPPPTKFSRYRSVRHAVPPPEPPPNEPREKEQDNGGMQRTKSMARYRRSKVNFQIDEKDFRPPVPAVPHFQADLYTKNPPGGRTTTRRVTEPITGQKASPRSSPHHSPRNSKSQAEMQMLMQATRQSQTKRLETENKRLRRKVREFQEREAAREAAQQKAQQEKEEKERAYQLQKINAEKELQRKRSQMNQAEQALLKQKQEAEQARLAEVQRANLLEEQKRKDLERLQKELDAAVPNPPPFPIKSPKREKFAFFSRKAGSTKDTPPATATTVASSSAPSITHKPVQEAPKQIAQVISQSPQRRVEPTKLIERPITAQAPKKVVEIPQQIQQGGGGIVPQTDAPVSASNAGERRVLVRCKQSSVNLPVTPETTPKEIIYSAANFMTQNIIPSTAILIESYTQLGLERRVRRYEHVRDVMNSWDRDTQNAFLLQNSDTPRFDTDLELSGVPKEVPADVTVYMYHSQKPGSWIKRHITLLSSGQIFIHKKPDAKLGDKHTIAICHLSDFDIYSVTPQQLRKVLKAPKKFAYAIKSQQKTAVFLNTENFVHFFSTDNEELAETWYAAVQSWRSWYLVNRMGGGKKAKKAAPAAEVKATNAGSALLSEVPDEAPYMIGSFAGLGLDDFRSGSEEDFDSEDEKRPRQIPFHLRNSILISTAEAKREAKRHPPIVSYKLPAEEEEFNSAGLLGRSYTTRQQNANSKNPSQHAGPFTDGPNLLNRDAGRTLSMRSQSQSNSNSNSNSSGLARSNSKAKPKPLLDFTPTFKEAPQWDKTGKGHGVQPIAGVPLVEVATTPADVLVADVGAKQTVFRRETTTARPITRGGGDEAFVKGGLVNGNGGASVMNRGRVRYD